MASDPQNIWLKNFVKAIKDGQLDLFATPANRPRRVGKDPRLAAPYGKCLANDDDYGALIARRRAFLEE